MPAVEATLYTFGLSIWSAVPEIAIVELGYPSGSIDKTIVDVVAGENFAPSFLKINPNGTLPTLTTRDGQVFTNTTDVTSYLVKNAPKKVASGSQAFIKRIHEESLDPNFILLTTRNDDEFSSAKSGFPFTYVDNRQQALHKYISTPEGAAYKQFYEGKIVSNGRIRSIYTGEVPESEKKEYYQTSTQHWQNIVNYILNELPAALPDSGFIGGAVPGEDDFHVAGWLARVVFVAGGNSGKGGYVALEKETKDPIPAKVAAYFDAWTERPGWQSTYADGLH